MTIICSTSLAVDIPDIKNENKTNKEGNSTVKDLHLCLRPFLFFGRMTMILPIHGILYRNSSHLHHKKWGVLSVMSILLALCLIFNGFVGLVSLFQTNNGNVPELVWNSNPCIYFSIGCFWYLYLLTHANELIDLLNKWTDHLSQLSFRMEDRKLNRDVNLLFGCIFTYAIMENVLHQLIQLAVLDIHGSVSSNGKNNATISSKLEQKQLSALEIYYLRTKQPNWIALMPYHPILSIFVFVSNKLALYAWNYVDILIMIFARAASFHFETIFKYTEENIINNLSTGLFNYEKWQAISRDFEILYSLLERTKKFLSPLVFTSYAVNLFYMIIHLHMGLMPSTSKNTATEVYRTWSFIQISCRLYIMTFYSAKLNEYAQEFIALYRKCPSDCYSISVQRTERFFGSMRLGLTGLNCFVVTKPFMLNLVSVILTFEIVLMQASGFHGYDD